MKKIICFLSMILSFIFISSSLSADEFTTIRVKIANGYETGYFQKVNNEKYKGYYYDYLMAIKDSSWEYEFVLDDDSNPDEYDLIIGEPNNAGTSPSVSSQMYQSNYPVSYRRYMIAFDSSNYDISTNRIESYYEKVIAADINEIIIGTENNSKPTTVIDSFKDYCKSRGITVGSGSSPTEGKVSIKGVNLSLNSLILQGHDYFLTYDSQALENDLFCGIEFSSVSLHALSTNSNIIKTIDKNYATLLILDDSYFDKLYNNHFKSLYDRNFEFTDKELAFLESGDTVRIGVLNDLSPYCYVENGVMKGAIAEYLNKLSKKYSKLKVEYRGYSSSSSIQKALENNEIDINGLAIFSIQDRLDNISSAYFEENIHLFEKENDDVSIVNKKVGITNAGLRKYATKLGFDENNIQLYEIGSDVFDAYRSGEISAIIDLESICNYYISKYELSDLKDTYLYEEKTYFTLQFSNAFSDEGVSIFKKAIIDTDKSNIKSDITNLIIEASKKPEFSLTDFINKYAIVITTVLVGVFSLIVGLLVLLIVLLIHSKKKAYLELYVDKLTGGNTKSKFLLDVSKLIKSDWNYSIIYIDINNFKNINALFGEQKGDEVIREVYTVFSETVENLVKFARLYADRYVGLIKYHSEESFFSSFDTCLSEVYEHLLNEFKDFNVSIKIGIAKYNNNDDINLSIEHASQAAHMVLKTSGINYKIYNDEIDNDIVAKTEIERDMERALMNNEFIPYYQPKVDAITNEIIGAEALVRWNHSTRGFLSPGVFIPIFESNGFVINIDYYIFECVCKYLGKEIKEGRKPIVISSNFSKAHLLNREFVSKLVEIAEKYDVPKEYLEIELTETMSIEDFSANIDLINEITAAGFKLAIDDFGSGDSSIQLLYKLAVNTVKLDATYARRMDKSKLEDSLMQSIIDICHENDIEIICEGVETKEQLQYILEHRCQYVQGYYYSKPLCEEDFREFRVKV